MVLRKKKSTPESEVEWNGGHSKPGHPGRSHSRSHSRSGSIRSRSFFRDNGREERDTRSPSTDEYEYVSINRSNVKVKGKTRNSLFDSSGKLVSKDKKRGRSKSKSRARSQMASPDRRSKSRSRAAAAEVESPKSRASHSTRSSVARSKSKSGSRFDSGEQVDVKDEKKSKKEAKVAEDEAYDKLQKMLGITCGVSSTCAIGTIIALHLL